MLVSGKEIQKYYQDVLRPACQNRTLHIVVFGAKDGPVESFIRAKKRFAHAIGVDTVVHLFEQVANTDEACAHIHKIAKQADASRDGMIVQLPLPAGIDYDMIVQAIPHELDVDVLNPDMYQRWQNGDEAYVPPVAGAVQIILKSYSVALENKNIIVAGKGNLVGKPVHDWLTKEAIPHTMVDEHTKNAELLYQQADILITGIGKGHFFTPDMLKKDVVVIDAGSSSSSGILMGDVHPDVAQQAQVMTPTPGGVGPVTVASLFGNVCRVDLYEKTPRFS